MNESTLEQIIKEQSEFFWKKIIELIPTDTYFEKAKEYMHAGIYSLVVNNIMHLHTFYNIHGVQTSLGELGKEVFSDVSFILSEYEGNS